MGGVKQVRPWIWHQKWSENFIRGCGGEKTKNFNFGECWQKVHNFKWNYNRLQMLTLGLNISGLVKDILKPDVLNTFPEVFSSEAIL